jgi:parallel beta-helix repeat protein
MSLSNLAGTETVGILITIVLACPAPTDAAETAAGPIRVTDFLPEGFVSDGSVSYQTQLQQALDAVPASGGEIVFAPLTYRIDDPSGLRIRSHLTLRMEGARFLFDEACSADGQLFHGEGVADVHFQGGTIVGRNDVWPEGVNIRGIHLTGPCRDIRITGVHFRDLSSNGIGIFATAEAPASDVWVVDSIIDNCCNHYGDYQAPPPQRRGPEKSSTREDQGLIALYHVHDFAVRGCRLEDSRSDGTHFYFCERGQFTDNRVYRAKMGGYFLESCRHVLATGNVILDNGSRGVTIERGSQFCTLSGNTIAGSGREGLWIPDSLRCTVTGNVFSLNGRKFNGEQRHHIWNANITINQAKGDKLNTPTAYYLIADNIIETDAHQIAAVRVDTRVETENILIEGNLMIGENRRILIEGPDQAAVTADRNLGGEIERTPDDP